MKAIILLCAVFGAIQARPPQAQQLQSPKFSYPPFQQQTKRALPVQPLQYQQQAKRPLPVQPLQYQQQQNKRPLPVQPQQYQSNQQYKSPESYAKITRYDRINDLGGPGGFYFHIETSDGFRHQATGQIKPGGAPQRITPQRTESKEDNDILEVEGEYSYLGPDGVVYTVYYLANENGFQPAGEHIPPAASTSKKRPQLGIPSAALASLAGGGLG